MSSKWRLLRGSPRPSVPGRRPIHLRADHPIRLVLALAAACAAAGAVLPDLANAHGIAGKRFFPATIETDDPFVADEASFPTVTTMTSPGSPTTQETDISADIFKVILPNLGVGIAGTYIIQDINGQGTETGWANFDTLVKYQFFKSDEHETILSIGFDTEIGGTGTQRVGADEFTSYTPTFFWGKGMGDLPDSMDLLKPFAVTGTLGLRIPDRDHTTHEDGSADTHPHVAVWGFAVQYSIPYLQSNVRDIGLREPFNRIIPLVEFAMETPLDRGQRGQTTGTIDPGFLWIGNTYQIGFEALIPIDSRTARGVGGVAQLHFYLDDLFPSVFGKPLFGE